DLHVNFKQLFKIKLMTLSYVPLKAIQLLSETFFSKMKNKKVIWSGTLKWDTLYNSFIFLLQLKVNLR
ncbi:hypothetical protein ALC57_09357, partial [Trachymyrmex cornetzi]